ncbi:MAG: hypothetical protein HOJ35_04645 [Bdellovibrionales bacterium]|nr:hypothetical protein [Bdellovibrionales bacterium]
MKISHLLLLTILIFIPITNSYSLPIDWHGSFGVDATKIENIEQTTKSDASFYSYRFKLNPNIIINDAASIKSELVTGYSRSGLFGTSSSVTASGGNDHIRYFDNQYRTGTNQLEFSKLYLEIYSNTATYLIGRHSAHWGLGAVINQGDNTLDRHSFLRDGVTMQTKIGNFYIAPFVAILGSGQTLGSDSRAHEYGASLLYDNLEKEIKVGLYYNKKINSSSNTTFTSDADGDNNTQSLGESEAKLIDIYFSKKMKKLTFSVEVPLTSGTVGNAYDLGTSTSYSANAIIAEAQYKLNNTWNFGLNAGTASGDDGSTDSFGAMYLSPNYRISNIMFRYNSTAVTDSTESIYDSSITNASYGKLFAEYSSNKSIWRASFIYAQARETPGVTDQSKDLGLEIDLDFEYKWNSEVTVSGLTGYHLPGAYYSYGIDSVDNSYIVQLSTAVEF